MVNILIIYFNLLRTQCVSRPNCFLNLQNENKGLMNVLKIDGMLGVSNCIERVLREWGESTEKLYRATYECRVKYIKIEKSFKIWGGFLKFLGNQVPKRMQRAYRE